jgi:predicted ester cyclase
MPTELTHQNKNVIWDFWQRLNNSTPEEVSDVIRAYTDPDTAWYGPHPLNRLQGVDALISEFWQPLLRAFPDVRRKSHLFFGGQFDGKEWVTATGHFSGTFSQDWLGIPATGQKTHIRFGEFCAVADGRVMETYLILDLLDMLEQGGIDLLPHIYGGEASFVPGPQTGDGVLLAPQNEADSVKSLKLVEAMLAGLRSYDQVNISSMRQADFWRADMLWYGPAGIGTTRGLRGFEDQHQIPFLKAFPNRQGGNHKARFAEGMYVASTGWPSLYATHKGDYLGISATGSSIGLRVMDWWRREGDYLAENWVLLDMVDLCLQLGVDLLERLRVQIAGNSSNI